MLNLSRIRAITLDLDDTLWPVWPAIHRAEDLLREWLTAHAPRTAVMYADPHQRQLLRADTEAQWADHAHDLSVLRRESIRLALQRSGDDPSLAEPAFEVFFDARMQVELFEDAIPLLDAMAARWPIVAVSNGNADVHRVGIGRYFAASVSARDAGVGKPDPRIFAAACASVATGRWPITADSSLRSWPCANACMARKASTSTSWPRRTPRTRCAPASSSGTRSAGSPGATWAKASCSPRPISINNKVKPTAAPNTCFWLAAKPKRAPELRATTLTGPGVIEVARAKAAMEMIKLIAVPFYSNP